MAVQYNAIQTFYADPEAVNGAAEIMLTSVELFFKKKPGGTNVTGVRKPGVVLSICEVTQDVPDLTRIVPRTTVRVGLDSISTLADATVGTTFAFSSPVPIKTGRFYGIAVRFEDPAYELWINKQGDKILGTNNPSGGSVNILDGRYYESSSEGQLKPLNDVDAKFVVRIAKFIANTVTLQVVNRDYEFFSITNRTDTFRGGEFVYQNVANGAGTISVQAGNNQIVGTSTAFDVAQQGTYIVAINAGGAVDVMEIATVVNTTFIETVQLPTFSNTTSNYMLPPVGKMYQDDPIRRKLILDASSANSTNKFTAGGVIRGEISQANATIVSIDDFSVDQFIPKLFVNSPASGQVNVTYSLAYSNGSQIVMAGDQRATLNRINEIRSYDAIIRSRSNEVMDSYLFGSTKKSALATVTMTVNQPNTALYSSPYIRGTDLDFFTIQNKVNSSSTGTVEGVVVDTEVYRSGTAKSKYISNRVTFANNRFAEDVRVYMTAYRPQGTDIKVYAKVHNSADPDAFDDKSWTPLFAVENGTRYSSSDNVNDYIEYSYSLPRNSDPSFQLPNVFTTTNGSPTIVTATPVAQYFNANTGVDGTNEFITTTTANQFVNGDAVFYTVETGNTAISSLTVGTCYYVVQANSSGFKLAATEGGSPINLTASSISETGHKLAYVKTNDVVKIYSSLFPENNMVASVATCNSSAIVLYDPIANSNLEGTGFRVQRMKYPGIAFTNILNDNVSRYYNSSGAAYDKFNSMQVKVVMLSNTTYVVPKVDQIQVIGVSA